MTQGIGVDLGGSGIRAGRVVDGQLQRGIRVPLSSKEPPDVMDTIVDLVVKLGGGGCVGIGVPGYVSSGRILKLPNLPGWEGVPLAQVLQRRLGAQVVVENDANCAAAGAWLRRGAVEDLVLLTLGTGVGGGIVSGGRLVRGSGGTAGEIGHLWMGGERRCGCGAIGCLETWAGTVGLRAAAAERGRAVADGFEVVEAARGGEDWALEVIGQAAEVLGRATASLINLLDPHAVVFAGGLAGAVDLFGPIVRREVDAHAIGPAAERVQLVWEGRADDLAILGAVAVAAGRL